MGGYAAVSAERPELGRRLARHLADGRDGWVDRARPLGLAGAMGILRGPSADRAGRGGSAAARAAPGAVGATWAVGVAVVRSGGLVAAASRADRAAASAGSRPRLRDPGVALVGGLVVGGGAGVASRAGPRRRRDPRAGDGRIPGAPKDPPCRRPRARAARAVVLREGSLRSETVVRPGRPVSPTLPSDAARVREAAGLVRDLLGRLVDDHPDVLLQLTGGGVRASCSRRSRPSVVPMSGR